MTLLIMTLLITNSIFKSLDIVPFHLWTKYFVFFQFRSDLVGMYA